MLATALLPKYDRPPAWHYQTAVDTLRSVFLQTVRNDYMLLESVT
jgi:hypothetical protein